jgi:hypothetical protein
LGSSEYNIETYFDQIIVPEFSATLGYAGEIRVPLNGDHMSIMKYSSSGDNNYRVVSGTLAALMAEVKSKVQSKIETK